ncbi:MAG: c-type cytochrome [Polyangiaceae bacterium]
MKRTSPKRIVQVLGVLALFVAYACKEKPKPPPDVQPTATAAPSATLAAPSSDVPGNAELGKALVAEHQCNRCHEGTGLAAAPPAQQCVQCHRDIADGKFNAPAASLAKWKPVIAPLTEVPSFVGAGARFKRSAIENYLLQPHDLRPKMTQLMPRLALTRQEARHIAAYLVPDETKAAVDEKPTGDVSKGRTVLDTKGCGSCHAFSGVAQLQGSAIPVTVDAKTMARATVLAPDLRYARDRMTTAQLENWLRSPHKVKADTTMPDIPLTDAEVKDAASYILAAELSPKGSVAPFVRLPVLTRKVTFEEVDKKVLHRTCWHCHSDPDFAIGDGGPGNSGGFGFKPRGLNLASYEGVSAGLLDKGGQRASVFAKGGPDQLPLMIRSLVARHNEEAGAPTGEVRGMPLGMPPLTAEEIQLVDTWVAQGRPK